ncbi:hypothetical protein F5884DRAFT_859207 [Xylogone sp. PMI_703]|nr:hypothetical protein F5884DRAFT_859207 [Xylogone sp. PMI_703]
MHIRSGVVWFEDEKFLGSEISFPDSTWRLETKLSEHEYYEGERSAKIGLGSEARAVFLCSKLTGSGPEQAIIKIRMQIPWIGTVTEQPHVRAKQATKELISPSRREVEALTILTRAKCSSSPTLFSWECEEQDGHMWVPGGYILYILMEKLPGIEPTQFYNQMDRKERDDLRASFKEAWLECVASGVVHGDHGIRNLLWDRSAKK